MLTLGIFSRIKHKVFVNIPCFPFQNQDWTWIDLSCSYRSNLPPINSARKHSPQLSNGHFIISWLIYILYLLEKADIRSCRNKLIPVCFGWGLISDESDFIRGVLFTSLELNFQNRIGNKPKDVYVRCLCSYISLIR